MGGESGGGNDHQKTSAGRLLGQFGGPIWLAMCRGDHQVVADAELL
jgi:hypothetical protein